MSQGNKPKLTNKQVEYHLNNLYGAVKTESDTLTTIMKVLTDYISFSNDTVGFQTFLKEKYKKVEEKKTDEIKKDNK